MPERPCSGVLWGSVQCFVHNSWRWCGFQNSWGWEVEGGSENKMQGLQKPEHPCDGALCVLHEMGDVAGHGGFCAWNQ